MTMRDILSDLGPEPSDADPVRRAQIQMKRPLAKRFYETVSVEPEEGGFAVRLDGRTVKTPARKVLRLPTQAAAELVAGEWRAQTQEIDPATMPATRLANTAIDAIAGQEEEVFADIVRFSGTDMLCYRADGPQELVARQAERWDLVIDWAASVHGARFILAEGIMHQEQPAEAVSAYAGALRAFSSPIELACLHVVTTLTGSALLALAFAHRRLDRDEIWALAHLDEDWTDEHWGVDAEAQARRAKRFEEMVAATALFAALRPAN